MASSLVGKQIGNYKITRQLGEGGMGAVYMGEHPLIGKKVAVKVLHDELAQKEDIVSRFFNEAKAVNDIGHVNIVDIVDFGKMKDEGNNDIVYFVMEFLDGESLNDRLKKGGFTQPQALHVIAQCASALAASHAKGIVHRDLKPDNIYLVKRGSDEYFTKLLDFGIAKLTGATEASHKTRAGSVLGTPAYMSPEQCDGRGNIDHRSDIYSLGMVLYEMLTGRVAFTGEGFGEILVAQITLPPTPPTVYNPNIPAELEAVVMKCLEKDRELRFQNMDELREMCEALGGKREPTGLHQIIDGEVRPGGTSSHSISRPGTGAQKVLQPASQPSLNRPTTLSGAAGEQNAPPAPVASGGGKGLIFGLLGLLIIGGGAGGFFVLRKQNKPVTPPIAIVTTPPPPKVEYVKVLIDSTPQGASVQRAGVGTIGTTPLNLSLKKGEPTFDVIISLDGHKAVNRQVTTNTDREMLVALEKEAAAVVTPPPVVEKDKGKSSRSSSSSRKLPTAPRGDDDFAPVRDRSRSSDPDGVLAPKL